MMYSLPFNSEKSFTLTEKLFSAFILSALPLKVLTFVFFLCRLVSFVILSIRSHFQSSVTMCLETSVEVSVHTTFAASPCVLCKFDFC